MTGTNATSIRQTRGDRNKPVTQRLKDVEKEESSEHAHQESLSGDTCA
jgi:hypothetical protein